MHRSVLLAAVLLLAPPAAASASAAGCSGGSQHLETLEVVLPPAPASVRAGSTTDVPATVTRLAAPVAGAEVLLRLEYGPDATPTYDRGVTRPDGTVTLKASVPKQARGPLHVQVEAFSPVVAGPCLRTLEEYGRASGDWGRVAP